jgi:hypothetical protein
MGIRVRALEVNLPNSWDTIDNADKISITYLEVG